MKLELKAKYLQYLNQQKQDEGFTLIELLVVIIIIGILSAIALPSFLNQANKAKQSEAKQYVGSMNRQQQAYFLEKTKFTDEIGDLGLGIKTQTVNYSYNIIGNGALNQVVNRANPVDASKLSVLKSYGGGVYTFSQSATSETTTVALLCQSKVTNTAAPNTTFTGSCPNNFEDLSS